MYRPKYFKIQELVDHPTYERRGEKAFELLDERALMMLDEVREHFGKPVTVNNWAWNPNGFNYRGFRAHDCPVGASLSQHKLGRAFDFDVQGMTADEVRTEIIRARKEEGKFKYIGGLELGVNWVHMDCRNTERGMDQYGGIFAFYP